MWLTHPGRGLHFLRGGWQRLRSPARRAVSLSVYDVAGRRVRTLASGERPAGESLVTWDMRDDHGREVVAGIYFARLEAAHGTLTQKLVKVQ
jgi:flagellar hook assembly protein FlgD